MTLKSAKAGFFDSAAVLKTTSRATRKVLSRFGAFVRTRARSSIRRRKTISKPGQPPTSHTGLLKKFIFFSYEPREETVVIGPMRLNRSDGRAPELLEHGGSVSRRDRRGKRRRLKYRPRPFMGPALEKEHPKLSKKWRDSIRP